MSFSQLCRISNDENEDTDIEMPAIADIETPAIVADERTPSFLTESFLNDVDATNADAEGETQTLGEETKGDTKEMELLAPDTGLRGFDNAIHGRDPFDGCAVATTIGKKIQKKGENQQEDFGEAKESEFGRIVGVFDGHGGYRSAKYAAENLLDLILEMVRRCPAAQRGDVESIQAAIRNALFECDRQMEARGISDCGCTVTLAYITDTHIILANAGDSGALLTVNGAWHTVTAADKPNTKHNLWRIKALEDEGARVQVVDMTARVFVVNEVDGKAIRTQQLACGRGLGDHALKHLSASPERQAITCDPVFTVIHRDLDRHGFLALVTDGILDLTPVATRNLHIYGASTARDVAFNLVNWAVGQQEKDNCTAVVLEVGSYRGGHPSATSCAALRDRLATTAPTARMRKKFEQLSEEEEREEEVRVEDFVDVAKRSLVKKGGRVNTDSIGNVSLVRVDLARLVETTGEHIGGGAHFKTTFRSRVSRDHPDYDEFIKDGLRLPHKSIMLATHYDAFLKTLELSGPRACIQPSEIFQRPMPLGDRIRDCIYLAYMRQRCLDRFSQTESGEWFRVLETDGTDGTDGTGGETGETGIQIFMDAVRDDFAHIMLSSATSHVVMFRVGQVQARLQATFKTQKLNRVNPNHAYFMSEQLSFLDDLLRDWLLVPFGLLQAACDAGSTATALHEQLRAFATESALPVDWLQAYESIFTDAAIAAYGTDRAAFRALAPTLHAQLLSYVDGE